MEYTPLRTVALATADVEPYGIDVETRPTS